MKRIGTMALCLLAAAAALAQDSHASARQWIATGVQPISGSTAISILIQGYDEAAGVQTPLRVSASVQISQLPSDSTSWLDVVVQHGGAVTHRIVGDGERVWGYTVSGSEFASAVYQNKESQTEGHLSRMLLLAARWSPREADLAVRTLRDILGGSDLNSRWSPWLSGLSGVEVQEGRLMTDVVYRGTDSQLTYRLERETEDDPWTLTHVLFTQSRTIGGKAYGSNWDAQVLPGLVDAAASYTFIPPAGARARSVGG